MNKLKTLLALIIILFYSKAAAQDTLSMVFAGDIMQHTKQLKSALKEGADSSNYKSYDYSSYFKHINKYFNKADLAIANMEFTLEARPYTGYPTFSAPKSLILEAMDSGIDICLCANNHISDKGKWSLRTTIEAYNELKATYTGLYNSPEDYEKNAPLIITKKGIKIALINFTYGINGRDKVASPYIVPMQKYEEIESLINKAKEQGAELIIALPHWGIEYELSSNEEQRKWAEFMHDKGVNIIVGTHPHVIQEIEINYDNSSEKKIENITAYSLGNLISNMSKRHTRIGKILNINIVKQPNGKIEIIDYNDIWTWCCLGGRIEKGYTVIPIEDYINEQEKMKNNSEYFRMKDNYEELKQFYDKYKNRKNN